MENSIKKKIILIITAAILFLAGAVGFFRFVIGGDEDTWICVEGQWLAHGHPSAPMPTRECGK